MIKILLVFTGGTIGSATTNGCINTSESAPFLLLDLFNRTDNADQFVQFTVTQPVTLLSENLAPRVWTQLINAIEKQPLSDYDGIIITHGTDTLSFTATALGLYFHKLNKPMLLVSSDHPLQHANANGLDNFICAVEFIKQIQHPGVFVAYKNRDMPIQVHLATRLASCLQLSSDFISVQNKAYMQYQNHRFTKLSADYKPSKKFDLAPQFAEGLLLIRPYPGLDYRTINIEHVRIVLHDLYHSGTACASPQWGEHYQLPAFIEHCRKKSINVYLAPACFSDSTYQTTLMLQDAGASIIWNISIEAAYTKLLLAYGNFSDELSINEFLNTDIAGEHIL